MHKEQLNVTEPDRRKHNGDFLRLIPAFIVGAVILWGVVSFFKGILMYGTMAPIELNTEEKVNYITEEFHINDTNNIGSYTVSFHNGFMTAVLNDVKDIRDLCFENLANHEITEEDYYEIVDTPFNEHNHVRSRAALKEYDGRWPEIYHKGVSFETETDSQYYYIIIYKENSHLYCEVSKGLDYDVYKKLISMK